MNKPGRCSLGRVTMGRNQILSKIVCELSILEIFQLANLHSIDIFFSDDRFLESVHKSFLNQTTINLRKEK